MKSSIISKFFFKKLSNFWVRVLFPEFRFFGESDLSGNKGSLIVISSESPVDILLVRSIFNGDITFALDDKWFDQSFFRAHIKSLACIRISDKNFIDNARQLIFSKSSVVFLLPKDGVNQTDLIFKKLCELIEKMESDEFIYLPAAICGSNECLAKGIIPKIVSVKMISACPFIFNNGQLSFERVKSDLQMLEKAIAGLGEDEFPSIFPISEKT